MALQCAEALAYAHELKVVHRDLKPDNMIITTVSDRPHIKILDFGIARLEETMDFTSEGAFLGTPRYMSPEQCRGEVVTPQCDQYSLGLVLYEMLAGKPAMAADSPVGYLFLHQKRMPDPPSMHNPSEGVSAVEPVVMKMLGKEPGDRFEDMGSVCEALQDIAQQLLAANPEEKIPWPLSTTPTAKKRISGISMTIPWSERKQDDIITMQGKGKDDSDVSWQGEHTPVTHREQVKIVLLGHGGILEGDEEKTIQGIGFMPFGKCQESADLAESQDESAIYLLGLSGICWDLAWKEWTRAGLLTHKTLACFDTLPQSQNLPNLAKTFRNLLLSPHPVDPFVLGIALSCMSRQDPSENDHLLSQHDLRTLKVASSDNRAKYVEYMLNDVRAKGARRPVLRALKGICDEMIMNAIFHAPVDTSGKRRFSAKDSSAGVKLSPKETATFRWAVGERYIYVSTRDPFGSLLPMDIFTHLRKKEPDAEEKKGRLGGMGLQIMGRMSHHLFFAVCPGAWCEVIALVERDPSVGSPRGQSLCVMYGLGQEEQQIGRDLWFSMYRYQDILRIKLKGEVNESSDMKPVFRHPGPLWLDLSEVKGINSMGIRTWLEAYRSFDEEPQVFFHNCSSPVISQINMIPAFADTGQVVSMLAPYYCPSCDEEISELIRIDEVKDGQPPVRACATCKRELEFDDMPEEYFAFLSR
jgi:hypothetical protein